MDENIILTAPEMQAIGVESSELTPEDIAKIKARNDLDLLRARLQTTVPNGELLKALQSEVVPQTKNTNEPSNGGDASKEEQKNEVQESELPVAPTTAFNTMRLAQLGYFPLDYSDGAKGSWKNISKWQKINKTFQSTYVLPTKMSEKARNYTKTQLIPQMKDSTYRDHLTDVVKTMKGELDVWIAQHPQLSAKNIEAAKTNYADMEAKLKTGDTEGALKYFDEITTKIGMKVNGNWHIVDTTTRDALQNTENTKLQDEDDKLQNTKKRLQKARDHIQTGETQIKNATSEIDALYRNHPSEFTPEDAWKSYSPEQIQTEIDRISRENTILTKPNDRFGSDGQRIEKIINGRGIAAMEASLAKIGNIDVNGNIDAGINASGNPTTRLGMLEAEIRIQTDTIEQKTNRNNVIDLEINENSQKIDIKNGQIQNLNNSMTPNTANIDTMIESKRQKLDRVEGWDRNLQESLRSEIQYLEAQRTAVLTQDANTKYAERTRLQGEITKLQNDNTGLLSEKRKNTIDIVDHGSTLSQLKSRFNGLKIVSANESEALSKLQEVSQKQDINTKKQQFLSDIKTQVILREKAKKGKQTGIAAEAKRSTAVTNQQDKFNNAESKHAEIMDALNKISDPSVSQADKVEMNEKLNTLLNQKNPAAIDLENRLKDPNTRASAMIELKNLLDNRSKGLDYFKNTLGEIESKINGLHKKAADIMVDLDSKASKPGANVESLQHEAQAEIGKINADIEHYNTEAQARYGAAAITLDPIQFNSLQQQSKLGGFFGTLNNGVGRIESVGSTKVGGHAMRGVYGILTVAGIASIGREAIVDKKQAAVDIADMAVGFVPVVGGVYDIGVGLAQFAKGEEITTDRKVSRWDATKRIGFGVLGLVPFAGQGVKALAKGSEVVNVARKVAVAERAANVVGKAMVLNEFKNLGFALVDATNEPIKNFRKTEQ